MPSTRIYPSALRPSCSNPWPKTRPALLQRGRDGALAAQPPTLGSAGHRRNQRAQGQNERYLSRHTRHSRPLVAGGQGASTVGLRGATGSFRSNTGQLALRCSVYPVPAGGDSGGAGVSARNLNSPLGGPTSMAIRPSAVRVQGSGMGCSPAVIALFLLAGLALVSVLGFTFFPRYGALSLPAKWSSPSPTPTPTEPTATPTNTFTPTPTSTSTSTPTATSTPISVAVPKLIGLSLNDATVLAKQKGFVLLNVGDVESIEFAKGLVAQQDPPPTPSSSRPSKSPCASARVRRPCRPSRPR